MARHALIKEALTLPSPKGLGEGSELFLNPSLAGRGQAACRQG
jgi:hypothetical protein